MHRIFYDLSSSSEQMFAIVANGEPAFQSIVVRDINISVIKDALQDHRIILSLGIPLVRLGVSLVVLLYGEHRAGTQPQEAIFPLQKFCEWQQPVLHVHFVLRSRKKLLMGVDDGYRHEC